MSRLSKNPVGHGSRSPPRLSIRSRRADAQGDDRYVAHRPVDRGLPLLHGYTHDRENGPFGHQFHVGVDAFGFAPIPMTLVDAWLEDLRREEEEIAAIVRDRSAAGDSSPLSEVAKHLGIDLDAL